MAATSNGMKNSQKGSVITIVLVVTIAGLVGYLVWERANEPKVSPTPPSFVSPTPTLSSTPPTETISGSEWLTYRDEKTGFEIKHPKFLNRDFGYVGETEGRVFGVNGVGWGDSPYMYFSISVSALRSTDGIPCRESAHNGTLKYEVVGGMEISGKSYPKCLITSSWNSQYLHVSFNYQGRTWLFQATQYDRAKDKAIVDQMLSTFKFTK